MNNRKILNNFHPKIDKEQVFKQIQCFPDSPVYEEITEIFEEIKEKIQKLCRPVGVMALGTIPAGYFPQEREAVYVIVTIGQEVSDCCTEAFAQGDYIAAMLTDAIADSVLFSLEEDIQRELRCSCAEWRRGICKRLEAPVELPMEIQQEAMRQTGAAKMLGLELSSGFMFRPLKTSCQIYLTSKEEKVFRTQHNCRVCPNTACLLRHVEPIKVTVQHGEAETVIWMEEGTLLDVIRKQNVEVQAPCGGKGLCGKCRIQVTEGNLAETVCDRAAFTEEELKKGWRLACKAVPKEDLTIRLFWENEQNIEVRTDFKKEEIREQKTSNLEKANGSYGFAVDLGTTTLVVQLYSLDTGACLETSTGLNSQRRYGADVVSRIQASAEGKEEELRKQIREDLWAEMKKMKKKHGILSENLERIVISGNTTMIHLLMGYPCESLGKAPFQPFYTGSIWERGKKIFPDLHPNTELLIYPGISAFVGADITAGICALQMQKKREIQLLIDLGTNGEMVLGNREGLLATSTAAGPAFEGGNITWGIGSIPGAISRAEWADGKIKVETIQNKAPVGICGTGLIELAAELIRSEKMDESGRLQEPWFTEGVPVAENPQGEQILLTQRDIRELQLAKAAVRAGIETLLYRYGISAKEVQHVYVAGGFGYELAYKKAMETGMFPEEFEGKIQAVGNSALEGAVQLLLDDKKMTEGIEAVELAKEVILSSEAVFREAYMDAMLFEC